MGSTRVVFAPDSYGDVLTAPEACAVVGPRLHAAGLDVVLHPMADGGRGTAATLAAHEPASKRQRVQGMDPLGGPVDVEWLQLGDGSFLESAQVLGLPAERLAPGRASSGGLGRVLAGARPSGGITVGLGGSAVVDGGLGLATGLGLRALDSAGRVLPPGGGAGALPRVARLVGEPSPTGPIDVWCDVRTRLADCVEVFGPQKGVAPSDVGPLTHAMRRWADVVAEWQQARGGPTVDPGVVGGGAAGGVGFALAAILGASLRSGAREVGARTSLAAALRGADVVMLGEGRLDAASIDGKVAGLVLTEARQAGARVVALVGEERRPAGVSPERWPDQVELVEGLGPDALAAAAERLGRRLR